MSELNEKLDALCFDHIEGHEPVSEDDLAWLIDTVDKLHERLSEAGIIVAALAVYGEQASLPALVRSARSQVDLIGAVLDRALPEGDALTRSGGVVCQP